MTMSAFVCGIRKAVAACVILGAVEAQTSAPTKTAPTLARKGQASSSAAPAAKPKTLGAKPVAPKPPKTKSVPPAVATKPAEPTPAPQPTNEPQTRDLKLEVVKAGETPDKKGAVRAVVVGISSYKFLPEKVQLRFAHRDAEEFSAFLKSIPGGAVPEQNVQVLTNERATLANVRNALTNWLPKVTQPNDVVYLFFAGHGTVENGTDGYFVAHDSDPQNLYATALAFDEVESLLRNKLRARHVIVIADACHSGQIGWVDSKVESSKGINDRIENLAKGDRSVLHLLAARGDEQSYEDERWGGGHGVFSYSLLQGLRGQAERDGDTFVRASELIEYVSRSVENETRAQQHPRVAGSFEPALALALVGKRSVVNEAPPPSWGPQVDALVAKDKVLGDGGAVELLARIPQSHPERAYSELRVYAALEELGQRGVSDYVDSNSPGLKVSLLEQSAAAYRKLRELRGDSPLLESKQLFAEGRAKLLAGDPESAVPLLERAVKLDPKTACPVNALGVAYERTGQPDKAMDMFRKAAKLTPNWSLPRYQIALRYQAQNLLIDAERELENAVKLQPRSLQARWMLMRVYRLRGKLAEAEKEGRTLIAMAPLYAPAYVEIGQVYDLAGQVGPAAEAYNNYVQLAPNYVDSLAVRKRMGELQAEIEKKNKKKGKK
jgi:tetratricopeptide (TPR) repeat protein